MIVFLQLEENGFTLDEAILHIEDVEDVEMDEEDEEWDGEWDEDFDGEEDDEDF